MNKMCPTCGQAVQPKETKIWFMFDNHTFKELTGSVDEMLDTVERCVEQNGGYGFIGLPDQGEGRRNFQWRKGDPWRKQARHFLETGTGGTTGLFGS